MLTTHKISADFYDDEFKLIAIHSGLADHAIAYMINKQCGLTLKRMANDLQMGPDFAFSVFDWEDEFNDTYWTLISNKCQTEEKLPSNGFFATSTALKTRYLIEEKKEIDYFLKIDVIDESDLKDKVKSINRIKDVITAYTVQHQFLKSKRNLIF